MTYFAAAILGVIQGLTEFLPISSTAHLLIAEEWLGFEDPGGVFTVMIQLGAVLAVMWLYRAKILNVMSRLPVDADGAALCGGGRRGVHSGGGGRGALRGRGQEPAL